MGVPFPNRDIVIIASLFDHHTRKPPRPSGSGAFYRLPQTFADRDGALAVGV